MPPRVDLSDFQCSVARTLDVVGDKWTLLILRDAFYAVRRFDDFARDLGVARNVLTDRLTRLVDNGIMERRRYQQRPDRYEYRLTQKGRDLLPVVLTMMHWGDTWTDGASDAPVLRHHDCGRVTHAQIICAECGEELDPFNVEVDPLPGVVQEVVDARQHARA